MVPQKNRDLIIYLKLSRIYRVLIITVNGILFKFLCTAHFGKCSSSFGFSAHTENLAYILYSMCTILCSIMQKYYESMLFQTPESDFLLEFSFWENNTRGLAIKRASAWAIKMQMHCVSVDTIDVSDMQHNFIRWAVHYNLMHA